MLESESLAVLGYPLSYSAGLACLTTADSDLGKFQQRSDAALYQAKSEGRGRLVDVSQNLKFAAEAQIFVG
jgi:GGDEF domain-containing protein